MLVFNTSYTLNINNCNNLIYYEKNNVFKDKLVRVIEKMQEENCDYFLITKLDDIACKFSKFLSFIIAKKRNFKTKNECKEISEIIRLI